MCETSDALQLMTFGKTGCMMISINSKIFEKGPYIFGASKQVLDGLTAV